MRLVFVTRDWDLWPEPFAVFSNQANRRILGDVFATFLHCRVSKMVCSLRQGLVSCGVEILIIRRVVDLGVRLLRGLSCFWKTVGQMVYCGFVLLDVVLHFQKIVGTPHVCPPIHCPLKCENRMHGDWLHRIGALRRGGGREKGPRAHIALVLFQTAVFFAGVADFFDPVSDHWHLAVVVCPISLLRLSLLRFMGSNFLGNSFWAWKFHPLRLRFCLSQTL